MDVTEEYAVSLELREKQERADPVNRRLRALNQTITAMTVEKETLTAKPQLHDELGTLLLSAKRYLCAPGLGGPQRSAQPVAAGEPDAAKRGAKRPAGDVYGRCSLCLSAGGGGRN